MSPLRHLTLALALLSPFASSALLPAAPPASCGAPPIPSNGPLPPRSSLRAASAMSGIWVHVHVITTAAKANRYTQSQIDAQISVLNARYAPSDISFRHMSTTFHNNDLWATTNETQSDMARVLRKGDYRTLNLYFQSDLPVVVGYAYYPIPNPSRPTDISFDGAYIHADALPGGAWAGYEQGIAAVHEVGHWLGLMHTFEGQSCDGAGDEVDDTPQQSAVTWYCPERGSQDSCPGMDGTDLVENYMDYTYDYCKTGFTRGQGDRMFLAWNLWRTY
ncbi:pregnancy-associated plasma protein-A-domain-containing protein [Elsinoe ampelina]|uniref:Pregnancy-associated plasma protein-A-domain-containing protein n=1 Tax=Elsinoe ampelina TaxID=302913 RepID=A0A6A6G406_9PEZI|nr:pregnancy-associated plasma protein-A-domain-containing protein [Elsinoe ampelina]